ncbi:MAG TPA: tRNA-uridine aminocarboxypropyltransferase [Polyangiales bacterium]|nr:tRNA-uridine aminocarboxypropyltransferase [Polyangiales bacterium]
MNEPVHRAACYRCFKPQLTCICERLPSVENRTQVVVMQHPRERLHPIGTARFAQLGLQRSAVHVAWKAGDREHTAPAWLPSDVGLLYPAPHARELSSVPAGERPQHLLVLDGTWNTARTLYRDKLWLHDLPHFRLMPEQPGRYRLRREPQHDYVSTIEAIVEALRILEPDTAGLDALLHAFDRMIDQQIELASTRTGPRRARKRRRPPAERNLPHALTRDLARLLIVYGESARSPVGSPQEFSYLVAYAMGSAEVFQCIVRPRTGLPPPEHLRHMGLTVQDFDGACDLEQLRERWQAFLGHPTEPPLMAAWNQRTLDLLAQVTGCPTSRLTLKGAYRAVYGCDAFSLEEVVAQRGLALPALGLRGRAERRLGGCIVVAQHLNARAFGAL